MIQPKILVDKNCAQLTRWLRFYGFDVAEVRGVTDSEVSRKALSEDRLLITRDQNLGRQHIGPVIGLLTDDLSSQLKFLFQTIKVPPEELWFTRCLLCNVAIELIPEQEVTSYQKIPPKVLLHHKTFWRCPSCKRIYWKGSHYEHAYQFLKAIAHSGQQIKTKDL